MAKPYQDEAKGRYMTNRGIVRVAWVNGSAAEYRNSTVPVKSRRPPPDYERGLDTSNLFYFRSDEDIIWVNVAQILGMSWSPAEGESA